jgi:hypothetical protein
VVDDVPRACSLTLGMLTSCANIMYDVHDHLINIQCCHLKSLNMCHYLLIYL